MNLSLFKLNEVPGRLPVTIHSYTSGRTKDTAKLTIYDNGQVELYSELNGRRAVKYFEGESEGVKAFGVLSRLIGHNKQFNPKHKPEGHHSAK